MKHVLSFLGAVCLSATVIAQPQLLRDPAINKDGSLVAFSYQGDIWTVPTAGGRAARLTIHEAYEGHPIFSPDGNQIAFSGARYGNNDLFVMPATGGSPKRLTWYSAADDVSGWSRPDRILFATDREFRRLERPHEVYEISPNGGTEERIMDAVGYSATESPDGRFIAFERGDINPIYRQEYRGPSDRDIWLYDTKAKTYIQLPGFETNDILPHWADNRTVYFLSSNDGVYNIYRIRIDEQGKGMGKPEQLTHFKGEAVRSFNISGDGSTIIYEKEMGLYLMKPGKDEGKKMDIAIYADDRFDPEVQRTFTNGINGYTVSPNGKMVAFEIRGEIFVKEANKEISRSVNVSNHAFRDRNPEWLNDSSLIFSSDRDGDNYDLYLVSSLDTGEANIFRSLKNGLKKLTNSPEDEKNPVVSPDGKKIAFGRGQGKLIVADIDAKGNITKEQTLVDSWDMPAEIAWSPDSRWLAYAQFDLFYNREIFIQAADNSAKPVNVTMHPRYDGQPVWSPDGSKLAFISERNKLTFDVWFIWLRQEDYEKSTEDWLEAPPADTKDSKDKDKDTKVKPVRIDFENIQRRLHQLTSISGTESDIVISKDGQTFYYTAESNTANGRDLFRVKWNGKELTQLTQGGSNPGAISMDREGKYLYYLKSGGTLNRMEAKATSSESLPFTAKMNIDYTAEREQIYSEAWRAFNEGFYDPQFHGHDWTALRRKYHDRAVYASTSQDFRDMFNYLLGEVNASHVAITAPDRASTQVDKTGLLGVELFPESDGMRIARVIPGTPAAYRDSKLEVGEIIVSVNGTPVTPAENFYSLLDGLASEKILLTVKGKDGKPREVVIRPSASITNDLYQEWVDDRKKLVDKWSNGRLGYIHIKSMDMASFEVMEREFTASGYGKDGIIIDVRYNGGGSTADYLMTVLNYKQHAYTIPRGVANDLEKNKLKYRDYYPLGERLIFSAWTKPSIALCNEGSYSNAEIFSHAYKTLGIGKLVGQPTNGSVISTGAYYLLDGSYVRMPGRGWYTKATDQNQELGPAVPDILVTNDPDWNAKDTDEQLKVATMELLKEIENK